MLLFMAVPLEAQLIYHPVKVDVGVIFGELTSQHAGFISGYVEPKINISNHFAAGTRFDYIYFSQKDNPLTYSESFTNNSLYWKNIESDGYIASLLLTGDYYLNMRKIKPFVGAGAGFYKASLSDKNVYIDEDKELFIPGAMVRCGFNIDHIRFGVEYNFLPNDVTELNYISIKLGIEIGGGEKKFLKP